MIYPAIRSVLLLLLINACLISTTCAEQLTAYVGTYTNNKSKGIYAIKFDTKSGEIEMLGLAAESQRPSFVAIHPTKRMLFAVNEKVEVKGKRTGLVSAFKIEDEGFKLKLIDEKPSEGGAPCHLVVDPTGSNILVANYVGGNCSSLKINEDGTMKLVSTMQHKGTSVNIARQRGPHAHSINVGPNNKFAFAADLGIDKIMIYQFDAESGRLSPNESQPFVKLAPGSGPRHFAFHPNGKYAYVCNELLLTVTAFKYDAEKGSLSEIQTTPTIPQGFKGRKSTAEVQVDPQGKFVFVSNRGHESIACFKIDKNSGKLSFVETEPTGGKEPRNFCVDPTGHFVLACNQNSDSIHVLKIESDGALSPTGHSIECPTPVCVKFANWKK